MLLAQTTVLKLLTNLATVVSSFLLVFELLPDENLHLQASQVRGLPEFNLTIATQCSECFVALFS